MKTLCALLLLTSTILTAHAGALDQVSHSRSIRLSVLIDAYARNAIAADRMYRGQVYTISGRVEKIVSDEELYVDLDASSSPNHNVLAVRCLFANTRGLESLTAGRQIAVTGTVEGLRGYRLVLKECSLPR